MEVQWRNSKTASQRPKNDLETKLLGVSPKYFDSIDHALLLGLLTKRFRNSDVVGLFRSILGTYHSVQGQGRGLPIGNLISQHCANAWLGLLDHWLKDECGVKGYLRYMDDFILFGTKRELKELLTHIIDFLHTNQRLALKDNIQLNRCRMGLPFLGYRIYPDKIMLTGASKKRFILKYKAYMTLYAQGIWNEEELALHLQPLVECTRVARSDNFRQRVMQRYG